jgi:hypothetical protein
MRDFLQDLKYAKEVIFHPFDAFYELKYRGKGNILVALLFFFLLGLTSAINAEFSGFVVNTMKKSELNSLVFFIAILLPYIFFVIGNYSITTLMDGKGTFSEIFTVVGYSLLPNIILMLAATIISRFITIEEVAFYALFITVGNLTTIFLIFIGLVVTHEYTFFRNIVSLILSFIAIALIIFVLLLMITLFNQLYGFIKIVIMELQN